MGKFFTNLLLKKYEYYRVYIHNSYEFNICFNFDVLSRIAKIRNLIKKNYKSLKFVFNYTLSPSQENVNKNKNKNKNSPPFGGMCHVACACVVACGMPG